MKDSLKVAKWEIKKNVLNKSFIISILSTPLIFIFFFTVPQLFSSNNNEPEAMPVFVLDEEGIWQEIEDQGFLGHHDWDVQQVESEDEGLNALGDHDDGVYFSLTEEAILTGEIPVFISEEAASHVIEEITSLQPLLKPIQLEMIGFQPEEVVVATSPIVLAPQEIQGSDTSDSQADTVFFERLIPGIFAGVILFSVVITGMMIFTSASQEKKEKVSEMILSSITPYQLMQGKIIGYFVLGILQVAGWIVIILPFLVWYLDIPILSYLFVPELLILVFISILGYLLFASIFVAIGATVDEVSSTSNFQGIIFMLPWLPVIFVGPILVDPSGLFAQIGSFIPFTAPGVLLLRLSIMPDWPWIEIIISLAILIVTIWLLMKIAGKIFKTGILLYGKNASPKEILKWIRQ